MQKALPKADKAYIDRWREETLHGMAAERKQEAAKKKEKY